MKKRLLKKANLPVTVPSLLTKRDLAQFLKVTERTVEHLQRRGLPTIRLGARRNRYRLEDVERYLQEQQLAERAT